MGFYNGGRQEEVSPLKLQKVQKLSKKERERKVLIGLINHHLRTGQPVGSNSLKDAAFDEMSSATIRNYFVELENEGFLRQLHTSGGRVPTEKAYRLYAKEMYDQTAVEAEHVGVLHELRLQETKELTRFLQQAADTLSALTQCAVFLSAPRFDHDFVTDMKLVAIDPQRLVCVIVTDFGVIQTEVLQVDQKLGTLALRKIESYFHWRLRGSELPENLSEEEERLAIKLYGELMMRYIVGYSNFVEEDVYRTGFSKLLHYTDFHDTTTLANSLALFENAQSMRLLLRDCCARTELRYWIGEDLSPFALHKQECSVLAAPYKVNTQTVGAVGVLGPVRMPYGELFALLRLFCDTISEALTKSVYKFKISFRQPEPGKPYIQQEEQRWMLIEDKRKKE